MAARGVDFDTVSRFHNGERERRRKAEESTAIQSRIPVMAADRRGKKVIKW